jgi:four helix bundle protein
MHQYNRLEVWRRGIALAAQLRRLARSAGTSWCDRALWEQITRAATSVPANVAEGAQRGTSREFARFLAIAMGSAAELHSLIRIAAESGAIGAIDAAALEQEAVALRRMAAALRARTEGARYDRQHQPDP